MGKTIVITGAGGGLGRAIARRFVTDGDTVILLGRTLSKVEAVAEELGPNASAVECDVADPASVTAAFAKIAETHPKIDGLINNAAIYEPFHLKDASDDKIIQTLMINTAGPIFCIKAAAAMMDRGAHIINVSSESVDAPFPMLSIYQTSKAALERFSKSMSEELRPEGIRVTFVRAGAMYEEGMSLTAAPEVLQQFGEALVRRGINPRERGVTHFNSVTHIFRSLMDLPPDLEVNGVLLGSRTP